MKLLNSFKLNKKKVLPAAIIVGFLVVAGSIAYAFSPQSPLVARQSESPGKVLSYRAKPTTATNPTPEITGGTKYIAPQPTVKPTMPVKQEVTENVSSQSNATATNTPIPQQTSPTPTSVPSVQTVSVEVKSPDGAATFSVDYSEGMNACDVLQKAKDTGKIKSVTFDDSYMDTLHSKYVSELNGFANNWTFTVNGSTPLGCSLSQPKPNDTIVWKFS